LTTSRSFPSDDSQAASDALLKQKLSRPLKVAGPRSPYASSLVSSRTPNPTPTQSQLTSRISSSRTLSFSRHPRPGRPVLNHLSLTRLVVETYLPQYPHDLLDYCWHCERCCLPCSYRLDYSLITLGLHAARKALEWPRAVSEYLIKQRAK